MTERFGKEKTRQKREPNIWVKLCILRNSRGALRSVQNDRKIWKRVKDRPIKSAYDRNESQIFGSNSAYSGTVKLCILRISLSRFKRKKGFEAGRELWCVVLLRV
jgi:hypothetical protein